MSLFSKDSCKCPRSKKDYCDQIEPLLKHCKKYKDFDLEKVKMLYEVMFQLKLGSLKTN